MRCGDWERLCVIDGLGHGPLAASASLQALEVFRAAGASVTPGEIIGRCHAALKSTRGAVMAVAGINVRTGRLQFAGVGNIAVAVHSSQGVQHLTSTAGIVGYNMRDVREQDRAWRAGDIMVLSTDGLSGRSSLERYPGLARCHPALIASVLHRDHGRDNDDATVVIARDPR